MTVPSSPRGALATCALVLFASSLIGCIGWLEPQAAPASLGPNAVGVTHFAVDDASRDRHLEVEAWYPAAPNGGGEPAVYEVEAAGMAVARLGSAAGARRDAAPLRTAGRRPVVLLSHGAGSTRFGNVGLAEVLASQGYVVAAPDHVGHTTADKVGGISDDDRAQSAYDRPLDLSRVLDELERQSLGREGPFAGMIDMSRVAVAGHSFGGRTALAIVGARFDAPRQARECQSDETDRRCLALGVFGAEPYRYRDARIKAALLIAPAGFGFYREDGVREVDAPVLVVGADRDETTPNQHEGIYRALDEGHFLPLTHAGHLTATDICRVVDSIGTLAKTFGGARAQDGCGEGFLPPEAALDLVSEAALPFFDRYLNGRYDAEEQLYAAIDPVEVDRRVLAALDPSVVPATSRTRMARNGSVPTDRARKSARRTTR